MTTIRQHLCSAVLCAFLGLSVVTMPPAWAEGRGIYMGDPVTVTTLPSGIRMNAEQAGGSIGALERSITEVADGVWAIAGYSVVNIYAVRAPEGLIVIDTGVSTGEARAALAALRTKTALPVKTIFYTHKHYMAGAVIFAEGRPVQVVGHPADAASGATTALRGAFPEIAPVLMARGFQQMGGALPAKGPDSAAGFRIAPPGTKDGPAALPLAITDPAVDGAEMILAGLKVRVYSAHSSDDDSVTLWLPDRRIAFNNFTWPVAANLFAPRGDAFRDARSWIAGVRQVRELRPVLVLSTHAKPMAGEDHIQSELGRYIDYHQILFDQTLRGILKGVGPGDIADFVKMPASYSDIREGYGETRRWYPRSMYVQAFGWFSGDAAELNPVSDSFRHSELTRLLGGPAAVLDIARKAETDNRFSWALELVNHVQRAEPGNAEARAVKARLLRKHAELTPASISHNFYMAQARALEGKDALPARIWDRSGIESTPFCALIDHYRIRVVPERTRGLAGLLAFRFPEGQGCGLALREGIAEFVPDTARDARPSTAQITLTRRQITDLFTGVTSLDFLIADPAVSVSGDRAAAVRLGAAFEMFPAG